MVDAIGRYSAGDRAGAVDAFMRGGCGPAYREPLDRALLAGAFEQAVADADTFFAPGGEQVAVRAWSFGLEQAARIRQPVLAVVGAESLAAGSVWGKRQETLLAWLPNVEGFILDGATHLLHVQNPRGVAEALTSFLARHPVTGSS